VHVRSPGRIPYDAVMPDASLAELYAEHAPAARRLALSLAPPHEADDLVAESFTRVISAMQRGREPQAFRPYLMTTVRHQAADSARGRHRLVPVPDPEPPAAPSAAELAGRRDEAARARAAYATLPERWQAVLWATEVEGKRPAQLAGQFGMSANSVAQLAVRAREGLREAYLAVHIGPHVPEPCRSWTSLLPASARDTLPARQRAKLDGHLRRCARCAALSGELEMLNTGLGELIGPAVLAGSAAAGRKLLSSVISAAHRPALAAVGAVALAGGLGTLQLTMPAPGASPPPHSVVRAGSSSVPVPARSYAPKHARTSGGSAGSSAAVAAAPAVTAPGSPATTAAGSGGRHAAQASPAGQLGDAVSGVTGAAGQAVGAAVPAAAPAGQLVAGTGAALGSDVNAVTGSAGQLAAGTVPAVTGTVSGVLGGL
jgi:RNA polymerase sigma factor (sigma-70 family)